MAEQVTGEVYKVFSKTWPKGNTTHSIKLQDNPLYYRTGAKNWAGVAEPGNVVTFNAVKVTDESANVEGDVIVVPKTIAAISAASGPVFSGDRQNSIVYQSSRKDALQYVATILQAGALKLPEKPALRLKALDALVDQVTADFFEDVNTLGAVVRANGVEDAEPEAVVASDEE